MMKKLLIITLSALACLLVVTGIHDTTARKDSGPVAVEVSLFDKAVSMIKKYESLNSARHWPFVGYGHLVFKGEPFRRGQVLNASQAHELLCKDLRKLCSQFREFGQDSLLLATLAYNIGPGNVRRSSVFRKLKAGNRDIKSSYLAHCRYKGKALSQLKRRRIEEFETLFIAEVTSPAHTIIKNVEGKDENKAT